MRGMNHRNINAEPSWSRFASLESELEPYKISGGQNLEWETEPPEPESEPRGVFFYSEPKPKLIYFPDWDGENLSRLRIPG